MMIVIWLDDAGGWKWLRKESIEREETCLIFSESVTYAVGEFGKLVSLGEIRIMMEASQVNSFDYKRLGENYG